MVFILVAVSSVGRSVASIFKVDVSSAIVPAAGELSRCVVRLWLELRLLLLYLVAVRLDRVCFG